MVKNNSLVSVIMNCYNSDKYLKEAIDSVIAQTYNNWEIIFWDNQSTDDSSKIIHSYNDERIKYFYAPKHTLLGEARNSALENINGEYIAFLDCDDTWSLDKIKKQVREFENNNKMGLCHTNYIMNDIVKSTRTVAHHIKLPIQNVSSDIVINYNNWKMGMSSIMISKEVIRYFKNDLFDPKLKLVEEYEFFCRVLKIFEIGYCKDVLVLFKWHGENNSIKYKKDWSFEYNYMAEKNYKYNFSIKEICYLENTATFYKIKSYMFENMIIDAKNIRKNLLTTSFKYFFLKALLLLPVKFVLILKPLWKRGAYA